MIYAVNEIGAVANMVHPLSSEKEIEDYLNQAHSRIMLCIDVSYPKVEAILKNTEVEQVIVVSPSRSMDFLVRVVASHVDANKGYEFDIGIFFEDAFYFFDGGIGFYHAQQIAFVQGFVGHGSGGCAIAIKMNSVGVRNPLRIEVNISRRSAPLLFHYLHM